MTNATLTENLPVPPRRRLAKREWLAGGALTAIIALILFPVAGITNGVRQRRNCESNMRSVMLGMMMYVRDYDEKFPLLHGNRLPGHSGFGWAGAMQSYIKTNDLYRCPLNGSRGNLATNEIGFTDYWLNSNISGTSFAQMGENMSNIMLMGEGIPSAANYGYAAATTPANNLPAGTQPNFRSLVPDEV